MSSPVMSSPQATAPRRFECYRFLLYALAPVLVLMLALLVFEVSAPADADFTTKFRDAIAGQGAVPLPQALAELRSRYIWFAAAILDLVISAYAIVFCGVMIVRAHPRSRLGGVVMAGIALGALGLAFLAASILAENALYRGVYGFTFRALETYHRSSESLGSSFLSRVCILMVLINILAVVAPTVAVLANCSMIAPRDSNAPDDLRVLSERMRRLKTVLSVSSALLVVGVLHMSVWLHWAAALVNDPLLRTAIEGVALAITTYWGATFTLMTVTAYVPVAAHLHASALECIPAPPATGGSTTPHKLLEEHGFAAEPMQRLPQMTLMLAPLVAGPMSSFLAGVIGK